ncbi:hypothetical protein RB623_20425 [Mesorhizobium sp. LHD-90]|uniref:hypothetical protein n=1 Tax=Mesorhizobium sp. LHD-90 TaxID=3071414 RepID=UPI0027E09651|nr:hypothetical protein [Mesorhizobium sp. LHD-90]MDQ6436423.1 hypothetical protein [Mesorhizobium sp. LHD-90]
MRFSLLPALGLAAALFCVQPALADDDDAPSFVRLHAVDLLENALTPEQTTTLQLVAYQAAIAAACEGFTLDSAKMDKAFEKLAPVDAAKMTDAQKDYHDQHLLVIYGILVGGELGAMADDVSAACAKAGEAKADPEFAAELVWE